MRTLILSLVAFVLVVLPGADAVIARAPQADNGLTRIGVYFFVYEDFMRTDGRHCGIDLPQDQAVLVAQPYPFKRLDYILPIYKYGKIVDAEDSPVGKAGCLFWDTYVLEGEVRHFSFSIGDTVLGVVMLDDLTQPDRVALLSIDRNGAHPVDYVAIEDPTPIPTPTPEPQAGYLGNGEYRIAGLFMLLTESVVNDSRGCRGVYGYDDIYPGTQVVIRDGNGNILGAGVLEEEWAVERGEPMPGLLACWYEFFIEVPKSELYVIEVSHRGEIVYAFEDMEENSWHVSITLGK